MIHWGMVGTGNVTEQKSGPAFSQCEGSTLYGVFNRTHAKAVDYASRHKIPVVFDSLDGLLSDPKVDAVYVATPPVTHKELALQVIASGKPLCLEKPMAMNEAECREVIEAARVKKVPVYVTYYRRSMEKFRKIKQLLDSETIGRIGSVNVIQYQRVPEEVLKGDIAWRFDPAIAGGGILVDMGSHVFDILDFIFGSIEEINGFAGNYGGYYKVEDVVTSSFIFGSGIAGAATFNFNTDRWLDRIEVTGETGKIVFSCFDDSPVEVSVGGSVEQINFIQPDPVYGPFVRDMVKKIEDGDKVGYVETAVRSTVILDKLLATRDE